MQKRRRLMSEAAHRTHNSVGSTHVPVGTALSALRLLVVGVSACAALVSPIAAQAVGGGDRTTVVLVHGAFDDGASWSKVIPMLHAKGLQVVLMANPLTSLAADVAAT